MKQKKGGALLRRLLFIAALLGIAAALYHLIPDWMSHWKSAEAYRQLAEDTVTVEDSDPQEKDWWSKAVHVAFEDLKQQNPDVVAWIRFDDPEAVNINYPVLYSGDNSHYLKKDINGEYSDAGCIFLEKLNKPDFSDYYAILYGHNMRDGTMFGDLKRYKEAGFYDEHQFFTLYTEDAAYRYQIFSFEDAVNGGPVYQIGFQPGGEYQKFLSELLAASIVDTNVKLNQQDHVLTLSTCNGTGNRERFAVHAVCIDEQKVTENS
ncbi:MAG: class B sortase [Clostridia bacterium]|nr:class B sortase [Clostridia bacterium]